MAKYTATFPTADRAAKYAEWLAKPGNWAINIAHKGRTVSFDEQRPAEYAGCPADDDRQSFLDHLESVGYFGSDRRRPATLNGVRAPFAW